MVKLYFQSPIFLIGTVILIKHTDYFTLFVTHFNAILQSPSMFSMLLLERVWPKYWQL
jgi:hypothetical protein